MPLEELPAGQWTPEQDVTEIQDSGEEQKQVSVKDIVNAVIEGKPVEVVEGAMGLPLTQKDLAELHQLPGGERAHVAGGTGAAEQRA